MFSFNIAFMIEARKTQYRNNWNPNIISSYNYIFGNTQICQLDVCFNEIVKAMIYFGSEGGGGGTEGQIMSFTI